MITIKQLITLAVQELGLSGEDPSTNLDTPECVLLDSLTRRVLTNLNVDKLYAKKSSTVRLTNGTYDLEGLPHLALTINGVYVNGVAYAYSVNGHYLTVNTSATDATVEIDYIGCSKVPTSVTDDVNMPSYITLTTLVAGICLEYCKVKGLSYSIGYYQEAYTLGLESAFKERRRIIIKGRRFL